ncbi:MAG: anaerobic ribonucleoside-triphosphate reductase activating protein [Puniceicoccales bacterium]|jgi:pyruvate formate lyase activating enzyme|nr:anaerobic ribonucleoside-triphosphate reductase activating protein [Puniceicoccales bacterium]
MVDGLLVGGIVPLSTVDYPDHLSVVVFLQGCPWRCLYCHNKHLQNRVPTASFPWEEVLSLLELRKGLIEGVVFSGGEPLLQDSLRNAMMDVREMGFKVGLHTAGAFPANLAKVVSRVDWVGFDLKHSFKEYRSITGVSDSGKMAYESLKMLVSSNVEFEARMTLHEAIEIHSILDVLKEVSSMGVKNIVLQKCRNQDKSIMEHPIFSDKPLLEDISKYFDDFCIRG